jgi:hypothetical protein
MFVDTTFLIDLLEEQDAGIAGPATRWLACVQEGVSVRMTTGLRASPGITASQLSVTTKPLTACLGFGASLIERRST